MSQIPTERPVYEPVYDIRIPDRPEGEPNEFIPEQQFREMVRCDDKEIGLHYFVNNYCKIHDNATRQWIPFRLWPAQIDALELIRTNKFALVPKSRQVGLTWICVCFILWHALFRPEILGLFFSLREKEASELLDFRLKGVYDHLPQWMKVKELNKDSTLEWEISTGSRVKASSTGGSDSYAASIALVDEAELVYKSKKSLDKLLTDLAPTVSSADGWLILISRSEKSRPQSTFKTLLRSAIKGKGKYKYVFIPWYARPDRTVDWYRQEVETSIAKGDVALDSVKEQYPATIEEFLSAAATGKRFNQEHIRQCYIPVESVSYKDTDNEEFSELVNEIPPDFLTVYKLPETGREYVACIDGAEGGEAADDSVCTIWDWETGEEVAVLAGKIESTPFALYTDRLATFYNSAKLLPERNNIGKTLILWWQLNSDLVIMEGNDSTKYTKKYGWNQNKKNKPMMWSKTADMLKEQQIVMHTQSTMLQLADVDGSTLDAPTEGHDGDYAITVGLFAVAKKVLSRNFKFALV